MSSLFELMKQFDPRHNYTLDRVEMEWDAFMVVFTLHSRNQVGHESKTIVSIHHECFESWLSDNLKLEWDNTYHVNEAGEIVQKGTTGEYEYFEYLDNHLDEDTVFEFLLATNAIIKNE